jgi:cell division protein FtsL
MASVRQRARAQVPWLPRWWLGVPGAIVAATLVLGGASLLPLSSVVGSSSARGEVERLRKEKTELEAQVQELEAQVAYLASLQRIEKEAKERLGMVSPEEVIYLEVDVPAPPSPEVPPQLAPRVEEKGSGRPWWHRILELPLIR